MANNITNFLQVIPASGVPDGTVIVTGNKLPGDMIMYQLKSGSVADYEWATITQTELKQALQIPDNITAQGNTFNGASQLVKLDVTGKLPALDGSNLTNISLPTTVTVQGNSFNGANQLVKLDVTGKLPALDGSNLTNLPSAGGGVDFATVNLLITNFRNGGI